MCSQDKGRVGRISAQACASLQVGGKDECTSEAPLTKQQNAKSVPLAPVPCIGKEASSSASCSRTNKDGI